MTRAATGMGRTGPVQEAKAHEWNQSSTWAMTGVCHPGSRPPNYVLEHGPAMQHLSEINGVGCWRN
eukprot:161704-Chlamydomonas_euryale.AAC.6